MLDSGQSASVLACLGILVLNHDVLGGAQPGFPITYGLSRTLDFESSGLIWSLAKVLRQKHPGLL